MDSVSRDIDSWMAEMPSADRAVEELRQRVGRMARLFDRLLDQVSAAHQVSRADWTALSVIIRSDGPCTPTKLAQALELTSGTVSTRIKRLTAAGLIESRGGETDARSRPVTATHAGHDVWAAATADRSAQEARILRSALDDQELADTNERLAQVLAALEQRLGPGRPHDLPRAQRPDD